MGAVVSAFTKQIYGKPLLPLYTGLYNFITLCTSHCKVVLSISLYAHIVMLLQSILLLCALWLLNITIMKRRYIQFLLTTWTKWMQIILILCSNIPALAL